MSNIYDQFPHPEGKVTLITTLGKVEIELFNKQCPKTCFNFLQHCLDQYYDGCIFHRVIPGFLVQTGDPTGTGTGGESVYKGGAKFKSEFNPRLRYRHRGLVGMAGENGDNRSQFFITLDEARNLNDKHTLFGKVKPETIYPIVNMAELPLEAGDRPMDPPKILSVVIDWNPYENMTAKPVIRAAPEQKDEKKKKPRKAEKDKSLLSCADEMDELDQGFDAVDGVVSTFVKGGRVASAHDIIEDDNLKKESVYTEERVREIRKEAEKFEKKHGKKPDKKVEKIKERMKRAKFGRPEDLGGQQKKEGGDDSSDDSDVPLPQELTEEQEARVRELRERQEQEKKEILRFKNKDAMGKEEGSGKPSNPGTAFLEAQRAKYAKRQSTINREKETVLKLNAFSKQLQSMTRTEPETDPTKLNMELYEQPEHKKAEAYTQDEDVSDWFKHTLKFVNPKAHLAGTLIDDTYEVIDPLHGEAPATREAAKRLRTQDHNMHVANQKMRMADDEKKDGPGGSGQCV